MADLLQAESHDGTISGATVPSTAPAIGVVGVAGYAGAELARLLLRHPRCSPQKLSFFGRADPTTDAQTQQLSDIHPQLARAEGQTIVPFHWDTLEQNGTQLLLLATPHEQSRAWVPEALARGVRVIDLSGAWRLQKQQHRRIYRFTDADPDRSEGLQREAVYGCPELHKDAISNARLVANPGCYATSIILALAPFVQGGFVDLDHGITCDAKSGVSGAGKTPSPGTHFMYAADNLSAYAVFGHRHTGELLEQLHLTDDQIQFTPHLLPIPRGILSTIYFRLTQDVTAEELVATTRSFYRDCPFVRVRAAGTLPQIQHVVHTNFCDLGIVADKHSRRVVLVSCLDNLLKGAAGQAIQNMNLMFGWDQTEGLL